METMQLAFDEFGNPDNKPLIILHGFFASSRNWRLVAQRLATQFHVYVPDMRNHGASPHHPFMDYPTMAQDLLHFIEEHKLDTVSVMGHSMGGKVAMWFALTNPNRLDKLMVVDIAPVSYQHNFDNTIMALKNLPLDQISNRKQAEAMLETAIPDLSFRQFLLQNLIIKEGEYRWRVDLDTFDRMSPHIAAFPHTGQLVPFIGNALFIKGGDSNLVKPEHIEDLFPKAAISTVANTGHWLHVQRPDAFTKVVEDFLGNEK